MFEQVFQGWSESDLEDNKSLDRMQELFRLNSDDIYMFLFDECDVDLEKYDISLAAAAIGRKGGQSKTKAKQKASAENGKKGGRPAKGKFKVTRKMANELADCIVNPPFDWRFWQGGFYIINGKLEYYASYHGQGLSEVVYNSTYEHIWTYENDETFLMSKKDIENYIYTGANEWLQEIQE